MVIFFSLLFVSISAVNQAIFCMGGRARGDRLNQSNVDRKIISDSGMRQILISGEPHSPAFRILFLLLYSLDVVFFFFII